MAKQKTMNLSTLLEVVRMDRYTGEHTLLPCNFSRALPASRYGYLAEFCHSSKLIDKHFRARDLRDGSKFVALKKIRMKLTEEGVPLNALREIAVLRRMDKCEHPNIVRLERHLFL